MPVQERVAMSLHELGSGNELQNIGDLYEVHKSTLSKIMRKFCTDVKKHLQPIFVQSLKKSLFRILFSRFSLLHDIPYIIGAINDSHNFALAPVVSIEDYYCRNSSNSALL